LLLHVWLPLAHPVAPVPASAVLSGTMIVTGLVGWLRFLPVGLVALPEWGGLLIVFGLAAAFYGAIVGIDQHNPKVVLAYSSVSQMGLMTMGIGMMLLEPTLSGPLSVSIAFFALHHGLAKSALFLGAGLEKTHLGANQRRWLVVGLTLPSLALAGAPFTSGMLAKSALVVAEASMPEPWATLLHIFLPFTSAITALLMTRFLVLVFKGPARVSESMGRAPWMIWYVSLLLVLVLPWGLRPGNQNLWTLQNIGGSLWPLGLALAIAFIGVWVWRRVGRPAIPEIPQGDVLLPLERLITAVGNVARIISERISFAYQMIGRVVDTQSIRAWKLIRRTGRVEALLERWEVAMFLAVLLGVALAVVGNR
jgi:hydrogenase-4 component B